MSAPESNRDPSTDPRPHPEKSPPNPEHRSSNAMLCLCIGLALLAGAYFLGFGAVLTTALSGGDPAIVVGSMVSALALGLAAVSGVILTLIGVVWMIVRVIADQTSGPDANRYRDIQR